METAISTEVQSKIAEAETTGNKYENYAIVTAEQYQGSAADLKLIKSEAKVLNETRLSLTRPIDDSKKKIMDLFRKPIEYLEKAEGFVKRAIDDYHTEQERIRKEEEDRLLKIQLAEAAKLRKAAEKTEAKVAKLKTEAGKKAAQERADQLKAQAQTTEAIAPVVESKVEPVAGLSTRKNWKCEVVDASLVPREYMIPDKKFLDQIVKQIKDTKPIPGVRIYSENVISSRS